MVCSRASPAISFNKDAYGYPIDFKRRQKNWKTHKAVEKTHPLKILFTSFHLNNSFMTVLSTDLSTLCRDKSHTNLPLPRIVCL